MPLPDTTPPLSNLGPNITPEQREQYNGQIDLMISLLQNRGWEVFSTQLREVERHEVLMAMDAKEAFEQTKHLANARTLRMMLDWPLQQINARRASLGLPPLPGK